MKLPFVSIIILNWNGLDDTIECLDSLKNITYKNFNIIVVDNGSDGNDADVLTEKYGTQIQLLKNDKNYGFAEGNNIAIRSILNNNNSEYILLLNNDTVVDTDFLSELVEVIESNELIGIVGPTIFYYNRPDIIQFAGGIINMWTGRRSVIGEGKLASEIHNNINEVDYIMGAALLIRTSVIKQIGCLDSDYFSYTEDVDWCFRAKKTGYKIFHVPSSKIFHKGSASTGGGMNPQVLFYIYKNSIIFMKKHASIYHWFTFIPISVFYLVRRSITSNPKKIHCMFRGILYGLFKKNL